MQLINDARLSYEVSDEVVEERDAARHSWVWVRATSAATQASIPSAIAVNIIDTQHKHNSTCTQGQISLPSETNHAYRVPS